MKNKQKLKEAFTDALGEIIGIFLFFGIGAVVIFLFGGSIDSESFDFDLIALIGIAAFAAVALVVLAIFALTKVINKKIAQKCDTPATKAKKFAKIPERTYTFTVDDNIRFLREITARGYTSIFEHPYLALYKKLHSIFGVKIQLNLFYEDEKFNLSQMSDIYREQWREASDWLKLSFHSRLENISPYESSDYEEVLSDCAAVQREIIRFASEESLAKTTTIHYCRLTADGCRAVYDNGVRGLLGLFGTCDAPRTSYQCTENEADVIRGGETVEKDGIHYAAIDLILNKHSRKEIIDELSGLKCRPRVKIMIHEQYFYEDYKSYQPDFENKLYDAFLFLKSNGYESVFFEDIITN